MISYQQCTFTVYRGVTMDFPEYFCRLQFYNGYFHFTVYFTEQYINEKKHLENMKKKKA